MQRAALNLAVMLMSLFAARLVSCSEQPCTSGCYKSLQLTEESLGHFTAHLANGPSDPLRIDLQNHLATSEFYQELYSRYLIGSVAVFGSVNEYWLNIVYKLCCGKTNTYVSELSVRLINRNDIDTVAQFAADNIGLKVFANVFIRLMKESWNIVGIVATKAWDILRSTDRTSECHHFLFTHFPVEGQYQMIARERIPLWWIENVYHGGEADLRLREVFLLARCSCKPDAETRKRIADRFPFFRQSLADDMAVNSSAKDPCPSKIPELTDDAVCRISRFMDVETVVCVMPMVCRTWHNLHSRTLMNHTKVYDLYLLDLARVKFDSIYTIKPWKNYLQDMPGALNYFGRCIEDGALGRIKPACWLGYSAKKYLEAVIEGRTVLPRIGGCVTQYDAFVKLFEEVYSLCEADRPILGKPEFLTDEEYERAVYHFVCERRLVLQLPGSLMVDDMPRLFRIIREDEEVMKGLVNSGFYDYIRASLALIVCGQTKEIPDRLARLIFGQTYMFERLVEPKIIPCNEYHSSIVESGIFLDVTRAYYHMDIFPSFLISMIMSSRDDTGKIGRMGASMAGEFAGRYDRVFQNMQRRFKGIQFEHLMASKGYSAEDVGFFKGVMLRFRLL